jgi:hypothetical protein
MNFAKREFLLLMALLTSGLATGSAKAETKLSDFNGAWHGNGSDKNTPFESSQRTNCRANIKADLRRMNAEIDCNGEAGLTKLVHLRLSLTGNEFTGDLTQHAKTRESNSTPTVLTGSVSGQKSDTSANFTVRFHGMTPNAYVVLTLKGTSSLSMQATTFGGELMNVTFNRTR